MGACLRGETGPNSLFTLPRLRNQPEKLAITSHPLSDQTGSYPRVEEEHSYP